MKQEIKNTGVWIKDFLFYVKTLFTIWFIEDREKLERRLRFVEDGISEKRQNKFPVKNIIALYKVQIFILKIYKL